MPKTILLGLDGSPYMPGVVELGLAWARRFDCLLVGLAIIDEPAIRGAQLSVQSSYRMAYDMQLTAERRHAEQILERFAIQCSEAQVSCKLLEDEGRPCEQILLEAQRYDLIMLGRHTHFHAGAHRDTCATLEQVLRATPRPVVVVPQRPVPGRITLIAYDGSPHAARALQAFAGSGLSTLAPVHVTAIDFDSAVKAARIADRAIEYLAFHEIAATAHPLAAPQAAGRVILQMARQLEAGLLVMGAYAESRFQEFFFGSATRTALGNAELPLFLYH